MATSGELRMDKYRGDRNLVGDDGIFGRDNTPDGTIDRSSGSFQDGRWVDDSWEEQARQQALEERNVRRQANADYLRSIGDFGQNASNAISAQRDKQYGAVLAAANFALKNGGFTPTTMIDVLGNDLNGPSGSFAGAAFRGKGKDAKFTVFLRGEDGRIRPGMQLSMADLFRLDNQRGGGSFDDEAYAIGRGYMSKYMTPQQIADATGANQLESLRDRVTVGAGGREVGGTTDGKATARLFGRGGDRHSRISSFGTGGAGTGYTMREYNGHTGEDTGFVNFGHRREEELDREADRQERIAKARQRGGSGRTFDEQMALEERRIAAREAMANAERERRDAEHKDRLLKFIQTEVGKRRLAKRKDAIGDENPMYTEAEIKEYERDLYDRLGLEYKKAVDGGKAGSSVGDNKTQKTEVRRRTSKDGKKTQIEYSDGSIETIENK